MFKKHLPSFEVGTKGSNGHACLRTICGLEMGRCMAQPHIWASKDTQEPVTSYMRADVSYV